MARAEHEHTDLCAERSQFVLVEVQVVVTRKNANVTIRMKPGAACWADVPVVWRGSGFLERRYPQSPEEAAECAADALREAFPGLF